MNHWRIFGADADTASRLHWLIEEHGCDPLLCLLHCSLLAVAIRKVRAELRAVHAPGGAESARFLHSLSFVLGQPVVSTQGGVLGFSITGTVVY